MAGSNARCGLALTNVPSRPRGGGCSAERVFRLTPQLLPFLDEEGRELTRIQGFVRKVHERECGLRIVPRERARGEAREIVRLLQREIPTRWRHRNEIAKLAAERAQVAARENRIDRLHPLDERLPDVPSRTRFPSGMATPHSSAGRPRGSSWLLPLLSEAP